MRWQDHKWGHIPIKIKIWVFSIKLHQGLGLNLVRLCENFVNISMHLFGGGGLGNRNLLTTTFAKVTLTSEFLTHKN